MLMLLDVVALRGPVPWTLSSLSPSRLLESSDDSYEDNSIVPKASVSLFGTREVQETFNKALGLVYQS